MPNASLPTAAIPRWARFVVAGLLALHFALAVGSKFRESLTYDEPLHLVSGLHYWVHNDYRFQPENGNLPQRWAALPAYLAGARLPPPDNGPAWTLSNRWIYGEQFLFGNPGQDHIPYLMAGRAMIALFSVGTGLLVFFWSRSFFGLTGALISLTFFAFSPEFLGHGALVTSDACMAFFMLAALTAWWRHLHRPGWRWGWVSAVTCGLACLAKFSAVLLIPMFLLLCGARFYLGRREVPLGVFLRRIALSGAGHVIVAVTLIWAAYGFRYSATNPDLPPAKQLYVQWDDLSPALGPVQGTVVEVARQHHLLPEAFLYGYTYTVESAQGRSSFLNGAIADRGWWRFFPLAFAYKTTLGVMIGIWLIATFGFVLPLRDITMPRRYVLAPLLALVLVYGGTALTSHLNIGHRHLLPIYPVLFIGLGALRLLWAEAAYFGRMLVLVALGTQAVEAVRATPHHLAYFNAFSGGTKEASTHLVDSSLDWGQGLPDLADWLRSNRRVDEPLCLAYFGKSDPAYYDIHATATDPIDTIRLKAGRVRLGAYEPGLYAISATALRQVYSFGRGPWTAERESAYRSQGAAFLSQVTDAGFGARLAGPGGADLLRDVTFYDALRANRLYRFLESREPLALVGGGSILVYRLSGSELVQAMDAPPMPSWHKGPLVMSGRAW